MSHDGHFCLFLVAVMSIQNLQSHGKSRNPYLCATLKHIIDSLALDPFALDAGEDETAVQQGFIHIRFVERGL